MYEQRFSPDGRWIAGESQEGEVLLCGLPDGSCRSLTPTYPLGVISLAWSGDSTRLFFLRHTSAGIFGELTSVAVHGGEVRTHGAIGPFQHRIHVWMDVSPRNEIVFAPFSEGLQELWMVKLR
jgi:hypothetical protein